MNKFPQKSIISKVRKDIIEKALIGKGERVIVALSGGPDSMCLLNILKELKETLGFELLACHFNHKLRGAASDQDEAFVINFCEKNNIEYLLGQAPDKNIYKNEEEARVARYAFFKKILEEGRGQRIAIAHNQNDLAETLLMRLIRGAGIKGFRSIPYIREKFIRPLLSISRSEIELYLKERSIPFCVDQTNYEAIYSRNKIRLNFIPFIEKEFNPNIVQTLANMSKHFADDYDFIEKNAHASYKQALLSQDENQIVLDRKAWLLFHPSIKMMVIRIAIEDLGAERDLTIKQLDEVILMIEKGIGKKHKSLPHSLRIELGNGKITISKK